MSDHVTARKLASYGRGGPWIGPKLALLMRRKCSPVMNGREAKLTEVICGEVFSKSTIYTAGGLLEWRALNAPRCTRGSCRSLGQSDTALKRDASNRSFLWAKRDYGSRSRLGFIVDNLRVSRERPLLTKILAKSQP
jgi:hypothetical protein